MSEYQKGLHYDPSKGDAFSKQYPQVLCFRPLWAVFRGVFRSKGYCQESMANFKR